MEVIYSFSGSVKSDLDSVKIFLKTILDKLNEYIDDEDLFFDIRLILNELIVNGAIHGNCENINKLVFLTLILDQEGIKINVKDEGCGINHEIDSYDVEDMKCSGRGLILVEALTDSLVLDRNEIFAVKYI